MNLRCILDVTFDQEACHIMILMERLVTIFNY